MEFLQNALVSLLAGLLLNFMPCVLPVLGIKLQGFMRVSSKSEVRNSCLFMCFGILFFMILMAGAFEILKKAGGFFWGFQLQNPFFIGFLLCVFTFLFLMLGGKINFNLQSKMRFNSQMLEGFLYGFLIVVFSISCTAPVVGSAITIASTFGANLWILMLFIGLGLCAPYFGFWLFPAVVLQIIRVKFIMQSVKVLSFILIAGTLIFIGFIYFEAVTFLTFQLSILFLIAGVFLYLWKNKLRFLIIAFASVLLIIFLTKDDFRSVEFEQQNSLKIVPFTEERLAYFQAKGYTVIINFDASWCVNCKGNNLLAFETAGFKRFLEDNNIIFMKGDLTIRNEKLENFMAKFNVYAVPFTIVFSSFYPQGKVLPVFLTKEILIKEIEYGF